MTKPRFDYRDWVAVLGLLFAFTPLLPIASEWIKLAGVAVAFTLILILSRGLRKWTAGYVAGIAGFWAERDEKVTREFLRSVMSTGFSAFFSRNTSASLKRGMRTRKEAMSASGF